METKRVCRFLIVIFLILSLFFYYSYKTELKTRTLISSSVVSDTVENLTSRGISIEEKLIEQKIPDRDIYFYELENEKAQFEKIYTAVCKNLFDSEAESTEFETPDGFSAGIYDKNSDQELGRVSFSKLDCSFVFTKNGIGISYGDEPITNMQISGIDRDFVNKIDGFITTITDSTKLGYKLTGSSSNDDFIIVTAMQTIDDRFIHDAYINFVFKDGELVIMLGNWVMSSPKAKYHNALIDGVDVLYKIDLEQVKSFEYEYLVYSLRRLDDKRCFIIPCWKIGYFDKDDNLKTAYIDAL